MHIAQRLCSPNSNQRITKSELILCPIELQINLKPYNNELTHPPSHEL